MTITMKPDFEKLLSEVTYTASRSSGAGGQHVNKVSTKVELSFDVMSSEYLDDAQKQLIQTKLQNKLTGAGILKLVCQQSRSQFHNKELVQQKFINTIEKCFARKRKRIATQPSKAAIENRLTEKKKVAEKKILRKNNIE